MPSTLHRHIEALSTMTTLPMNQDHIQYAVPYAVIAAVSAAVFFILYPFAVYIRDVKGNNANLSETVQLF